MALVPTNEMVSARDEYPVREIGLHDLQIALAQGWEDFMAKRGDLIFLGILYPFVIFMATAVVLNASILPLLFPFVAGSVVFGPAVASGYYELARRREQNLDAQWRHFFDVVRGPSALDLAGLTSINVLLFMTWVLAAGIIYGTTLGSQAPDGFEMLSRFLEAVFTTTEGWTMIIVGNLVGLVFVIVALAISVVSFPMVVDKRVSWKVAMLTSVRVTRKNPMTIAVWGLIVVGSLLLGTLPALIGLAVVFPVLGYATWHLYTLAVVR